MKVLHVYRTCYPETKGGVEQVIRFIASGTKPLGVETKILTLSDNQPSSYYCEGTEIISVKKSIEISSNGFSWKLIRQFKKLSKWADIIHYHYPWPTGDFLSLFGSSKPSIVTYHSDIVRQKLLKTLYQPLESYFLNHANILVATSPQYAHTSENLLRHKNKVKIIPLAVDDSTYPIPSKDNINKWREKVGEGFFLFVGVLRYYKGLDYLLEAAKINNLPVVIAGDGPERAKLEDYISKHNLNNIKLVGFISEEDKVALHLLSKAFVFPSHLRSEAFGISLIEAQLFKKPIISCDIKTGTSYVNIHQKTGLIAKAGDAKSLASALQVLSNDDKLCAKYGNNGYQRAIDNFTINIQAEKYFNIYSQLLKL
ncbi:glycosyltransferase family 4 protein [Vibrio cholerae]|uniref:glycosyltransferase family 4 protein n=1 Tax=Vibrio cholerae TaxID=666 RepID=UPI00050D02BD|nr:glycosyltransferase family 4 protein [Vibrio cholerae]EGR1088999.1 glycosyltransferase [Vibrio cholerae]TXZ28689.1 glycosyltransferase [Vibrio cholerae]BCK27013.1 Alpha-D-kanosaminyltransferase [Vibrio cholerae]